MLSLKDRLKEVLVNSKLLSSEQLDKAIAIQKEKAGRLSDIVVSLGFIKEQDLVSILSQGLGLPLIDLKRFKIDPATARIIPVEIARHYQIIAVSKIGQTITLAMVDPLNIFAIDHVKSLTGYNINPIISGMQDIIAAIELYYPNVTKDEMEDLVKEINVPGIELIKEEKENQPSEQELTRVSREVPVIRVTNLILEDAVKKKSSDILIEPWDKKMRVRFRIDGVLQEQQSPPANMHASIVSRVKVMSDLNIAEHRLPQDGRFKARISGREIDFRVSIIPSSFGEKVALRILDKSQANLDLAKLGFSDNNVTKIQQASKMPHGMFLVTGPTGSGKTTTLYSILKFVDDPHKNIVTVEDPVEFQLDGINQVTIKPDIGLTFASSLRAILRQDPNIIMIGEIRDYETVDIAIKSALTGHLVISTLHTTTAAGSIVRLINMGVEPFLINSAVVGIVAQRLVRKICSNCKEKYTLSPEIAEALKLDKSKSEFYRPKKCPLCFNTGYSGRVAIAEVIILSVKIRDMILSHAQEYQIKDQARKEGMRTLREEGIDSALRGLTTIEEVVRVTVADE
ncbi:MAG: Flp pilus assembly complex ATPase component TadA [Candidatus Omnitrophica bacterium]|jgi:type IV pilus assembly protein PilB|nr:Flp pilus assembly complex ATPase component TadA [Candidatus Omnitrophota bacterium]